MPLLWFYIWPSIDLSSKSLITNAKNTIPSTTTPPKKKTSANSPLCLSSGFFHVVCWGALSFGTQQGHKGPPGVPRNPRWFSSPTNGWASACQIQQAFKWLCYVQPWGVWWIRPWRWKLLLGLVRSSYGGMRWLYVGWVNVTENWGRKHVVIFVGSPQQLNIDILKPKWPMQFPRPMICGSDVEVLGGVCIS